MNWRTLHPHDHGWIVSHHLLRDELARRTWLAHVRREIAPTGRVVFRSQVTPWTLTHGLPPVLMVLVLRCVTDHGGPR